MAVVSSEVTPFWNPSHYLVGSGGAPEVIVIETPRGPYCMRDGCRDCNHVRWVLDWKAEHPVLTETLERNGKIVHAGS